MPNFLWAQQTRIIGVVYDAASKDPLPFVNVIFKNTSIGVTTGLDGKFVLNASAQHDSLVFSFIGYKSQTIHIQPNKFQEISVFMEVEDVNLAEVVIVPGENPAHPILRKVIANREKNNIQKHDFYSVEIYNKIQFDLNNVSENMKNRRVMRPFEFIFDYVDTSTISGKVYLPMMITESVSDYIFRKDPLLKKEVIKASKASGIENESISKFLGNMYQDVNVYDDFIILFNRNFVSPLSDFGLRFYKYYLVDSALMDGCWSYKIMFKPKRQKELTFTGEIWIADSSFAVKSVDMKIAENLNMNYINEMLFSQTFQKLPNGQFVIVLDRFEVDFNVFDNNKTLTGFYAHKTTSYRNYNFIPPSNLKELNAATQVDVMDLAFYRTDNYWDSIRHNELNKEELFIYKMVDTITNLPVFRTYYDIIALITSGYYNTEKFDFGPYFQTISFNAVEGLRLRIGGRTSNKWNSKLRLYGHLAYGTLDQQFKYGAGGLYIFNKNPRRSAGFEYKNDMEQLGQSVNAFRQDNIMASLLRRQPFTKLSMAEQYLAFVEYEWVQGLSNQLTFRHRTILPIKDDKFIVFNNSNSLIYNEITTSELEYNFRFAYKETYLVDKFNRTSLGTKFPVFNLWISYGLPNFLNSDFSYFKVKTSVEQWFNVRSFGWSRYILDVGKIFGTLPYPLLEIHPGNETYSFDKFAFNKMNYYEFISDEFVSLYFSHHFDGFFLNRIPLLRELEWREVAYFRGLVGRMNSNNQSFSRFLPNSSWLNAPYMEAGIAIENIFKVLRVDAGWRLSHLDNPDISKFGIMATLYLSF